MVLDGGGWLGLGRREVFEESTQYEMKGVITKFDVGKRRLSNMISVDGLVLHPVWVGPLLMLPTFFKV